MAGVRRAHCGGERGRVAHFAEHDDIGVLAQNMFQRAVKIRSVETDFALFNHGLIILENKFNRVFERNDVLFEVAVDVFNHRGERRGFAGAGRTSDHHDAARRLGETFDLFEQTELFKTRHGGFDMAHRQRPGAALLENVRAKSSHTNDVVGKIHFAVFFQFFLHMHRRHAFNHAVEPLLGRNRAID